MVLASGIDTLCRSAQATRLAAMLSQLHQAARPLTNLKDLLPCLLQRLSFATHGIGEGTNSAGGVPRFYKSVHVTEAQVPPPLSFAVGCHLLLAPRDGRRLSFARRRGDTRSCWTTESCARRPATP